jgi:hypothetical protein
MLEEPLARGANQSSNVDGTTVGVAATWLVGPSYKRRSITFTSTSAGGVTVGNKSSLVAGAGLVVGNTTGPLELTVEKHGAIVRMPWFGVAGAGGQQIGWAETFAD